MLMILVDLGFQYNNYLIIGEWGIMSKAVLSLSFL